MAEQEQTVDQQQEKAREKAEDDRYQRAEQQQAAYDDEYESRRETLSALALFQQDAVEQLAAAAGRIAGIIIRSCFPGCILSCATWERPCCWISWMHS